MADTFVFDAYGTIYDVQSVAAAVEAACPGHGEAATQIWRLKQLEYTWLRSLMGRYVDFEAVTRDSLAYTLEALGLGIADPDLDRLVAAYDRLSPYPEAAAALAGLRARGGRLAIFSNGSAAMLTRLVEGSGLAHLFEAVISVDEAGAFKPDPRAYALVERRLAVPPAEVVFVSANGFDIAGAKSVGFRVVRIARGVAAPGEGVLGPAAMFRALRNRVEHLDLAADATVASLAELPGLADRLGRG